ncbi:hypothetical protein J4729_06235 [Leisingera sp. HS039]|uniref:hypothetical protein n=1 Tax=Leisingera sp. HS039 TaxID=2818496 RepID=UPI001B3A2F78|nr:hypothetical protein [Leisingera sp. HS039]MBQ4824149.1 hypothetical protein [Leisingera sp. HS039]
MQNERVCAAGAALSRRQCLQGVVAASAGIATADSVQAGQGMSELEIYERGWREGQKHIMEQLHAKMDQLGGAKKSNSSRIQALFARRNEIHTQIKERMATGEATHEDMTPYYDEYEAVEQEMLRLPAETAADFAAKLITDSSNGALISDWETGEIWQEARRLVGMN